MKKKYLRQGLPGKTSAPNKLTAIAGAEQAPTRKRTTKTSKQHSQPSAEETSAEVKKVSKGADEEME